jgi:multiple sugar transport system substrate-binding protein
MVVWTAVVGMLLAVIVVSCSSRSDARGGRAGAADVSTAGGDHSGAGRVTVRWFVGLGTGSQPEQIAAQEAVVKAFNDTHHDIDLKLEIVDNQIASDVLKERMAKGDAPDIIGPVGIKGANDFTGQFLDLTPLIAERKLDLSIYEPRQINIWRDTRGGLTALPFGVSPSFLYYNQDLFDRAGLPYPPHRFGELYQGKAWTMDALYKTALRLTLDAAGHDATNPAFDPVHIVQWGFNPQFVGEPRAQGSFFGAGSFVAEDGSAQIPAAWLAEWQWYHDLVWKDHGAPNKQEMNSPLLDNGNAFNSGNVAMVFSHLWYTGSLRDDHGVGQSFFDLAVVPSYKGKVTSKLHADTFRILASTPHPKETFEVFTYLQGDAAPALLKTYGEFPARKDLRVAFLANLDVIFPQRADWSVAEASLEHPDIPSHEGPLPNSANAQSRIDRFGELLTTDPAADVPVEAARLRADLSILFAEASAPKAAAAIRGSRP